MRVHRAALDEWDSPKLRREVGPAQLCRLWKRQQQLHLFLRDELPDCFPYMPEKQREQILLMRRRVSHAVLCLMRRCVHRKISEHLQHAGLLPDLAVLVLGYAE